MRLVPLRKLARRLYRRLRPRPTPSTAANAPDFAARKAAKLARIRPLLRPDVPVVEYPLRFDCLTPELRRQFWAIDPDTPSAHEYDPIATGLIADLPGGLILDCGAGFRPTYYDTVVNFEIAAYPTTDVCGVGERLPFRDNSFDAAFSFAVLEHVTDPFACAAELARVLKPGGVLYCVVPFLQPYHGYPHHYFNMTHHGLARLFADKMVIERQEVNGGGRPIFSLTWIMRRWAEQLPPAARAEFLNTKVADLLGDPLSYMDKSYVTGLPEEANFELASTTSLIARKKAA